MSINSGVPSFVRRAGRAKRDISLLKELLQPLRIGVRVALGESGYLLRVVFEFGFFLLDDPSSQTALTSSI